MTSSSEFPRTPGDTSLWDALQEVPLAHQTPLFVALGRIDRAAAETYRAASDYANLPAYPEGDPTERRAELARQVGAYATAAQAEHAFTMQTWRTAQPPTDILPSGSGDEQLLDALQRHNPAALSFPEGRRERIQAMVTAGSAIADTHPADIAHALADSASSYVLEGLKDCLDRFESARTAAAAYGMLRPEERIRALEVQWDKLFAYHRDVPSTLRHPARRFFTSTEPGGVALALSGLTRTMRTFLGDMSNAEERLTYDPDAQAVAQRVRTVAHQAALYLLFNGHLVQRSR